MIPDQSEIFVATTERAITPTRSGKCFPQFTLLRMDYFLFYIFFIHF